MLTSLQTAAVAAAVSKNAADEAKDAITPGKHKVDILVHLLGELGKGEDSERKVTAALPQKKMLLAALMLNGVCVEAFLKRYLANEFVVTEEQETKLDEIWDTLAESTIRPVRGSVKFKGVVEIVKPV
jgi:hypothetical protein